MTLEEAQAKILELQEENAQLKNEYETVCDNNKIMETEMESLRKLNQSYFNKLTAQYLPEGSTQKEEEESPVSCEDFARTIKI